MDAGKSVGVLATNPGSASDYLGIDKVSQVSAPVICVPTTAGTAAEMAVEAVEQLAEDVGLPDGLSFYGAKEEDLPEVSKTIAESFMIPLSPRKATAEDILKICQAAM